MRLAVPPASRPPQRSASLEDGAISEAMILTPACMGLRPASSPSPDLRYSFVKDASLKVSILADLEKRFTVFEAKSKKLAKMLATLMG